MPNCSKDFELELQRVLSQSRTFDAALNTTHTPAAVLMPFVCMDGKWHLLFTKRADNVATHRGEISFPGGSFEPGDADIVSTALRETNEEIGVDGEHIRVLGVCDPLPTISMFCVVPVIGVVDWPVTLKINQDEVAKIILIPVEWLDTEGNWYEKDFEYEPGSFRRVIHYVDYQGDHLWGITAMITRMVLEKVRDGS